VSITAFIALTTAYVVAIEPASQAGEISAG
jgi:hypothetical protein